MSKIKVATVALNQTPLDWEGNEARVCRALQKAAAAEVQLLCFPEMAVCAYGCEDVFLADYLYEECLQVLKTTLKHSAGLAAAIGLPLMVDGKRYSAVAFVADKKLWGFYCKKHLANDGLHYEYRWFTPWPDGLVSEVEVFGHKVPVGDLVFKLHRGPKIGFEICEDAWVKSRLTGNQRALQPAIVLNPSASHFAFQKHELRRQLVQEGSTIIDGTYLYANMSSNEAGRIIYDGSCIIADRGRIISENKRFSFQEIQIDTAVVELREDHTATSGPGLIAVDWAPMESKQRQTAPGVKLQDYSHAEEFLLAQTLALFDYLRKSYSKSFILSLSGGVDSAACAVLVYCMVQRAVDELGMDKFKERLAYFDAVQNATTVQELMPVMLHCVYQATANSSATTRNAAASLAQQINCTYSFFDVEELVRAYKKTVRDSTQIDFNWATDDLALQNIQARVRAPGIWFLTNLKGGLLVTTSNRSEAAVGYATMDGDTCGGICPLGGVGKIFLRRWLKIVEKERLCSCESLSSLKYVNEQEPTAELRPPGKAQKDEEDLMPYDVLDFIEKSSIRDKHSPQQIFDRLLKKFSVNKETAYLWLEKFYALWSKNQWKRERYAPSFHMDDENLDPKTWCRFPILNGAYQRELTRIKQQINS